MERESHNDRDFQLSFQQITSNDISNTNLNTLEIF